MNIKDRNVTAVCFVLFLLVCCFTVVYVKREPEKSGLALRTFKTDGGWGYRILLDGKVAVSQPVVPALDTVMPFPDEESARKVGRLVLHKIIKNENISVTRQEVEMSLPRPGGLTD